MQINSLANASGDALFYDQGFRITLESCMPYLLQSQGTVVTPIETFDSYKYEGDLSGLLDKLHIPKEHHYAIMLANQFRSPADLKSSTKTLIIPSIQEMNLLKKVYQQKKNSF